MNSAAQRVSRIETAPTNRRALALWIGVALLTIPSAVTNVLVHHLQKPVKILQQSTEPPRKAFELVTQIPEQDPLARYWTWMNSFQGENLNQILIRQSEMRAQLKQDQTQGVHRVRLETMVLHQPKKLSDDRFALDSPSGSGLPGTVLVGKIRLSAGLAAGDRTVRIRHIEDGRTQEIGDINMKKGTFSIRVNNPNGLVRAELVDDKGAPLASGDFRITNDPLAGTQEIVMAPRNQIPLRTVPFSGKKGIPADHLLAASGQHVPTDAFGDFQVPHMTRDSWSMVRSRAPEYGETLAMVSPSMSLDSSVQEIPLFPKRLLKAFATKGEKTEDLGGMIWVQVLYKNKNLDDVEVSIEGSDMKPSYGNDHFVFSDLNAGLYQLVAKRAGKMIGHLNLQVDEGAVSVGTIEVADQWANVPIRTQDAFSGEPLSSRLDLQSLETSINSSGETATQIPKLHQLSYGYVYPSDTDYAPLQISYSDDTAGIFVPMIRQNWLESKKTENRIETQNQTGVVIGFVPEDDYEVFLPQDENFSADNVVYFDTLGRSVDKPVPGGGFILFNVPTQTQTISVVSKTSGLMNAQVVPVDAGSITALNISF
jgi:hypothetical protein